jgi:hypothetical protein
MSPASALDDLEYTNPCVMGKHHHTVYLATIATWEHQNLRQPQLPVCRLYSTQPHAQIPRSCRLVPSELCTAVCVLYSSNVIVAHDPSRNI